MAPLAKKCQQRHLKPVKSALYTTNFELGGGIVLFCCQKRVGGLGPFGPALKNRHTLLFKRGTIRKPIKTRKFGVICSHGGGFLTWRQSGVRGELRWWCSVSRGKSQRAKRALEKKNTITSSEKGDLKPVFWCKIWTTHDFSSCEFGIVF